MNASSAILSELSSITGTGKFHSAGAAPFFLPQLCVQGLGEVSFPLTAGQAKELTALAEAAPFGKGTRTVMDEKVRKCWQIDADTFSFGSAEWSKFLKKTVDAISADLGIKGRVSALPYKLLIYGKGGHFKPHRDTEKLDSMFGSLIIALPSEHEGGRLFIRHDGQEVMIDFSDPSRRRGFQFGAFFADCEHEVQPVLSGYRFCVAYNLRLEKGDASQLNLPATAQSKRLLPALAALKGERKGRLSAVLLEHSYTEANLALHNLKGNDQARAFALMEASKKAGITAHLALVTLHQSGELEGYEDDYGYGHRGRSRYRDPKDGTMGEIHEESLIISHWRDSRDRSVGLGDYLIEPEAIIATESISAGDPHQKAAEGYTGNAGCTMEYWYRRAAIVLWASEDEENMRCQQNLHGACVKLQQLAGGKNTKEGSPFHRLARAAIALYPGKLPNLNEYTLYYDFENDPLWLLLFAVAEAKSHGLLQEVLEKLPPAAFVICDSTLWEKLFESFGAEVFDATCSLLLKSDLKFSRKPLFQVLGVLAGNHDAKRVENIAPHLAGLGPHQSFRPSLDRRSSKGESVQVAEAKILLSASHLLTRERHRKAALEFLQSDGSLSHIRNVTGPVLVNKSLAPHLKRAESLGPDLLSSAIGVLSMEVERPLPPFPDWTRPCPEANPSSTGYPFYHSYSKKGDPIQELRAFMADPDAKAHHFARPQAERSVLESFIQRHALDLDFTTLAKGSPHVLVCTKNDNSHQAALALRAQDELLLGKLRTL